VLFFELRITSEGRNLVIEVFKNSISSHKTHATGILKIHIICQIPFHDQIVDVWCAINTRKIISPIFIQGTVNSE
jgi:hypothetical protein